MNVLACSLSGPGIEKELSYSVISGMHGVLAE